MIPDVIEQVAIAMGRIIHAGTGEAVLGQVRIAAEEGWVVDKMLTDGTFVVSGYLDRLFPKLDIQGYVLNLKIRIDSSQFHSGFREIQRSVTIPTGFTFEAPVDIGTISLAPDPVIIRGRVYDARPGQDVFGLRAKIYFDHPAGTMVQQVRIQEIASEPARSLIAHADAEQSEIELSERSGLLANQLLRIGAGSTLEYGIIKEVSPAQPNRVILCNNLAFSHFIGQPVRRVEVQVVDPPNELALKEAVKAGDRFLLLTVDSTSTHAAPSSTRRLIPDSTIKIVGSSSTENEYQTVHRLRLVPIVGADVTVKSGTETYTAKTNKLGHFSISDKVVIDGEEREVGKKILAGATIGCKATGFKAQERRLLIDFSQFTHEEYFYLVPPKT
jgi:hypothetical protein